MSVNVSFKSDPLVYDIDLPRVFSRVLLQDSIFQMYPYAELTLPDKTGEIINNIGFTDQLDVDIKVSVSNSNGNFPELAHSFFVRPQKIKNPILDKFIAPDIDLFLSSKYKKLDSVQSQSFDDNLSNIIDLNTKTFQFLKKRITTTSNQDKFYQGETTFMEFIERNIGDAYSTTFEKSPFVSFINLDNQFHFIALDELISTNIADIPTFTLTRDLNTAFDIKLIRGLTGEYSGLDFDLSQLDFVNIEKDATSKVDNKKITDIMNGNTQNANLKFLFRKPYADIKRNLKYYGLIIDSASDPSSFIKGWRNSHFLDTFFPLRLRFQVQYPDIAKITSGKNINLDISHPTETYSDLFYGQWTILESKHIKNKQDILYSELLVGRNRTGVNTKSKFFSDYF